MVTLPPQVSLLGTHALQPPQVHYWKVLGTSMLLLVGTRRMGFKFFMGAYPWKSVPTSCDYGCFFFGDRFSKISSYTFLYNILYLILYCTKYTID